MRNRWIQSHVVVGVVIHSSIKRIRVSHITYLWVVVVWLVYEIGQYKVWRYDRLLDPDILPCAVTKYRLHMINAGNINLRTIILISLV
jgi:hypothetical protein